MEKPKNWILVAILTAMIGFVVNTIGGIMLPSGPAVIIQIEDEDTQKPLTGGKVIIIIDGKEIEQKPDSDGEVKIKIPKEDIDKKARLKVIDKDGFEQYSEDILLNDEIDKEPIKVDVFDFEGLTPQKNDKAYSTVVNNFKFDFQKLKREGGQVTFYYNITNMDDEDRKLTFIPYLNVFFDDQGNQINQNSKACFGDEKNPRCNSSGFRVDRSAWDKRRNPISNTMPAGIPLKMYFVVRGVSKKASKFIRADFDVRVNDVKTGGMHLTDIELPAIGGGPNIAIHGDFAVKWSDIKEEGETKFAYFKVLNLSDEKQIFSIGHATAYDNQGNQYTLKKAAFGKPANPLKNKEEILPKSSERFYMPIKNIDNAASTLERITLQIGDSNYDFDTARNIP